MRYGKENDAEKKEKEVIMKNNPKKINSSQKDINDMSKKRDEANARDDNIYGEKMKKIEKKKK